MVSGGREGEGRHIAPNERRETSHMKVLLRSRQSFLEFSKPVEIVTAHTIEDVLPALRTVEQRVNKHSLFALGFISYEAAPAFDSAFLTRRHSPAIPLVHFGLFGEPVMTRLETPANFQCGVHWRPSITNNTYDQAIRAIKNHLGNGRTYQVNFTYRFDAYFSGIPQVLFSTLFADQPSNYSCYIET